MYFPFCFIVRYSGQNNTCIGMPTRIQRTGTFLEILQKNLVPS